MENSKAAHTEFQPLALYVFVTSAPAVTLELQSVLLPLTLG
jgi:hypothetical protein